MFGTLTTFNWRSHVLKVFNCHSKWTCTKRFYLKKRTVLLYRRLCTYLTQRLMERRKEEDIPFDFDVNWICPRRLCFWPEHFRDGQRGGSRHQRCGYQVRSFHLAEIRKWWLNKPPQPNNPNVDTALINIMMKHLIHHYRHFRIWMKYEHCNRYFVSCIIFCQRT